jgi:hypothetical protein
LKTKNKQKPEDMKLLAKEDKNTKKNAKKKTKSRYARASLWPRWEPT